MNTTKTKIGITPRDTRGQSPRSSSNIFSEIITLAKEYEERVAIEAKELDDAALIYLASGSSSGWYGGHSIANYRVQVQRSIALAGLRRNLARRGG